MKKALLVIGNPLRGDDGVTTFLGHLVEQENMGWKVFYGQDTPESEFHNLREFEPDMIVVADAMTGLKVGSVEVIDISDERSYMYSTHNLPTPILLSYLKSFCKGVLLLGLNVDIENVLEINPGLSNQARQTALIALEKVIEIDSIFDSKNTENYIKE